MIYVTRHGQTDWNLLKKTQGHIDIELNETGIKQAKQVGNELSNTTLDVILCSPLKRCKSTAEIICGNRNIPIIEVEELKERRFGEFEGKKKNVEYDWEEFWNWESNHQYEQAENVRDFYYRISNAIEKIKREYNGKNVLIVSHAGVCAIIYCYFNNLKPNGKLKIPKTGNCELSIYN